MSDQIEVLLLSYINIKTASVISSNEESCFRWWSGLNYNIDWLSVNLLVDFKFSMVYNSDFAVKDII